MDEKLFPKTPIPTNLPKSSLYYQSIYVERGKTGLFRDSRACDMLHQDVLSMQRDLARRLASAAIVDKNNFPEDNKEDIK